MSAAQHQLRSKRHVVIDLEATGFDALGTDRIISVSCLELCAGKRTGREFRTCVNPERIVPQAILELTGFQMEQLESAPTFSAIADELLAFLSNDELVSHNIEFDRAFLNAEFRRLGHALIPQTRCVDLLSIGLERNPNSRNDLQSMFERMVPARLRESTICEEDTDRIATLFEVLIN